MALEADLIADRRQLRRRLTLWRLLAVCAGLAAVLAVGYLLAGPEYLPAARQQIARIKIEGMITGDERTLQLINRVRNASAVQGVVLQITSPGGTVSGAEALYDSLRRLAAAKPTVAVVDGLAASGGYIAALGADRIVARQTSLVGSIGVLFQMPNASTLLDRLGVKVEAIRSSPLKAAPSGFEPTSPEAREALQRVVDDSYAWFRGLVGERRGISGEALATVSDGRVHTGRQALELQLVDELGSEREAIAWLTRTRNVPQNLPVLEWKRRSESDSLGLWSGAARLARAAGLDTLAALIARAGQIDPSANLDGALALWQPVIEN